MPQMRHVLPEWHRCPRCPPLISAPAQFLTAVMIVGTAQARYRRNTAHAKLLKITTRVRRRPGLRSVGANLRKDLDVALLKRLRNGEQWLRCLCIDWLRENGAYRIRSAVSRTIWIVDGTIVREPGKAGSQWILYSIRLPSSVCDFFEVTGTIGEGSGESLNRPLRVDTDYSRGCRLLPNRWNGIRLTTWADVLVGVNPQSFVAYFAHSRRISLLLRLRTLSKVGEFGQWQVVLHGRGGAFAGGLCAVRNNDCAIQQASSALAGAKRVRKKWSPDREYSNWPSM